jgi:hypothetical protein
MALPRTPLLGFRWYPKPSVLLNDPNPDVIVIIKAFSSITREIKKVKLLNPAHPFPHQAKFIFR